MTLSRPEFFPLFLFLIPIWVFLILFNRRIMKNHKIAVLLRTISLTLLILSACGISRTYEYTEKLKKPVVILTDVSDSTEKSSETAEIIKKSAPAGYEVKILYFSSSASENLPENTGYTNIENALITAGGAYGTDCSFAVITDGNETDGNFYNTARSARFSNAEFFFIRPSASPDDSAVIDCQYPHSVYANTGFDCTVKILSGFKNETDIEFRINGKICHSARITASPGITFYTAHIPGIEPGSHILTVSINDAVKVNNNRNCLIQSVLPLKVAVCGKPEQCRPFINLLKSAGLNSYHIFPEDLKNPVYSAVILCNVSADEIPETSAKILKESALKNGIVLGMTGGPNSFGNGGFSGTILADILPVHMLPPVRKKKPDTAIIIAIDESGSMAEKEAGIRRIDTAIDASSEALGFFRNSWLGIMGFSSQIKWIVPLGPVYNINAAKKSIEQLAPYGGTNIYAALSEANKALAGLSFEKKYILLVSDGRDTRMKPELVHEFIREDTKISTVGIGNDADFGLLEKIAAEGGGTFYKPEFISDLPAIFEKEAVKYSGLSLVEDITPVISGVSSPYTKEFSFPVVSGYNGVTPKSGSQILLLSRFREALLVTGKFGTSSVFAFTPDISGNWTKNWFFWPQCARFWSDFLKGMSQIRNPVNYSAQLTRNEDKMTVSLYAYDRIGNPVHLDPCSVYIKTDSDSISLPMNPVSKNHAELSFDALYSDKIHCVFSDSQKIYETLFSAFPPETEQCSINETFFSDTETLLHGKIIDIKSTDELFRETTAVHKSSVDFSPSAAAAALILMFIEFALRRFRYISYSLSPRQIYRAIKSDIEQSSPGAKYVNLAHIYRANAEKFEKEGNMNMAAFYYLRARALYKKGRKKSTAEEMLEKYRQSKS